MGTLIMVLTACTYMAFSSGVRLRISLRTRSAEQITGPLRERKRRHRSRRGACGGRPPQVLRVPEGPPSDQLCVSCRELYLAPF